MLRASRGSCSRKSTDTPSPTRRSTYQSRLRVGDARAQRRHVSHLQATQNLAQKEGARPGSDLLKTLIKSVDRSNKFESVQKSDCRAHPKGIVMLAFSRGLQASTKEGTLGAIEALLESLG